MAGAESSMLSVVHSSQPLSVSHNLVMGSPAHDVGSAPGAALIDSLKTSNRYVFLQPPRFVSEGSLHVTKTTLDAIAPGVSDETKVSSKITTRKRKRSEGARPEILRIRKVHVEGLETGQVWQQAKRVIHQTLEKSEEALRALEKSCKIGDLADAQIPEVHSGAESEDGVFSGSGTSLSDQIELDSAEDALSEEASSGEDLDDSNDIEDDIEAQGKHEGNLDAKVLEEGELGNENGSEEAPGELIEDANGLNDGFFSIDEFNRQTQFFEEQDARADPNSEQLSDDDDVDWHADPMMQTSHKLSRPHRTFRGGKKSEQIAGNDGGPKLGHMDRFAPEDASDYQAEHDLENGNTDAVELDASGVYYTDFFALPPKKGKKGASQSKLSCSNRQSPYDDEVFQERAINSVGRDLFDDVSELSDPDEALSDVSAGDPKSRRSAHERCQAKVADEIRKLEAELVAKRAWTLSGETNATDRPVNSLLEHDLDFEHAGKPLPVITQEVSDSIEEIIKRRILAGEFDEIVRRRPDALADPSNAKRGLLEVDDSKGKQSLAELYEENYIKSTNPDGFISQSDEKLRREEREIEHMWKNISVRLDGLSNWHCKPKPAAPTLTVLSDIATVSMEDAQPATAQGVTGESALAPQEVYKAGSGVTEAGEVIGKSGLPVARQELSREDKLRRRKREKGRLRKHGAANAKISLTARAQSRKETMADLKKGAVKVINRKGETVGLDGKAIANKPSAVSANYKL